MFRLRTVFTSALIATTFAIQSQATLITFTGGDVYPIGGGGPLQTNNSVSYTDVDRYEEDGFRLDFIPDVATGFASHVGNYYGAGNDVIHSHWATGDFGNIMTVEITKVGGGTFDINFFNLTSNTDTGGSFASGNERAFVEGFIANGTVSTGPKVLLPVEDWGFPTTQVGLGAAFNVVDTVRFTVENPVDCFGMDDFFIDEVPEPTSLALCSLLGGLVLGTRRSRQRN